jgi:hypothetical protein
MMRRVCADLIGCAALGLLTALFLEMVPYHSGTFLVPFIIAYSVLLIPGYFWWVRMHRETPNPRWARQALASMVVASAALLFDFAVRFALHRSLRSVSEILTSSGILFGTTLLISPGYTCIALAGFARSLVRAPRTKRTKTGARRALIPDLPHRPAAVAFQVKISIKALCLPLWRLWQRLP